MLSALHGIIRNIQSSHPSFKGMRYKFGLECDLCRGKTNKPCERHNEKACSRGDCVHIWDLESLKKPLHHCKNNLLALDNSKLHESTWVKATGKYAFCVYLCWLFNKYITFFRFRVLLWITDHVATNKKIRHETKSSGVTVVLYTL